LPDAIVSRHLAETKDMFCGQALSTHFGPGEMVHTAFSPAGSVPTNSMHSNLPSDLDWQDPAAARASAPRSAVTRHAVTANANKC